MPIVKSGGVLVMHMEKKRNGFVLGVEKKISIRNPTNDNFFILHKKCIIIVLKINIKFYDKNDC